ncbi:MAG TPA: histidine kinase [Ktedonobacterales bacterium]|nr:histidine kinase [Ktedonobacterales bacterium]
MRHSDRARVATLLFAAAMIALGVAFVWLHLTTPSDGARIEPHPFVWRSSGVVISVLHPQRNGLRTGDIVTAVDGKSLESWGQALADPAMQRSQWQPGQVVTYTVIRNGVAQDVPVTLGMYPLDAVWQEGWSTILFALVFEFIALYIVLRRPGEQPPLVLLLAASGILGATTWSFGLQISDLIGSVGFWLYKATTSIDFLLYYIASLHFALMFPRRYGFLVDHPWRVGALYLAPFVLDALYLSVTGLQSSNVLLWLGNANTGENIIVALLLVSIIVTVRRTYRASQDVETRRKIRWLVFGALLSGISGLVLWQIPANVFGHPFIDANALGLLALPLPLAIAIAVLRHHLFDIDTILNRTLVYGGLTAIVVGVYIGIVAGLGSVFQAHGNLLISLVGAGAVAVLVQPLRLWLQRIVDRLMFGERDNPDAVLTRLGQRLETTLAPDAVLPTIAETIANALKLPSVAIVVSTGNRLTTAVEYGVAPGPQIMFPLVYQSEMVGQLLVSPRSPDEPLSDADKHLLEHIAHQAGIAVHATRLSADLQRSRERLVTAREEERRRIRRDLHDGVGPALAGLTLKVGAARNVVTRDPVVADRLLAELGTDIEATIADIRRLVYALRPPALDELGLVAAIRGQIAQYQAQGSHDVDDMVQAPMRVTMDAPAKMPPLPAAIEVATYRIVSEALANAAKHAQARNCRITLILDKSLHLEIADDGCGLSPERKAGVGLVSMRERAEELGGTCVITSDPGKGTQVVAQLPLAKE